MKVKTDLKAGNVITNAANQAKTVTPQTVNLAQDTWKSAATQVSNLWGTVTNLF